MKDERQPAFADSDSDDDAPPNAPARGGANGVRGVSAVPVVQMSLRPLHQLLRLTTHLLDQAATDVRATGVEPVLDHIERIGRAMLEVLEVQRQLQALQPDLTPRTLAATSPETEANRLFVRFMTDALALEDVGKPAAAAEMYATFIGLSRSFTHREIARAQVRRLG